VLNLGLPWLVTGVLVLSGVIAVPDSWSDWLLLVIIGPLIALLVTDVLFPIVAPRYRRSPPPRSEESFAVPKTTPYVSINNLRIDAAGPCRVVVKQTFDLAVAIRRPWSPELHEQDLEQTSSGRVAMQWPILRKGVQMRLEVNAPDCEVLGDTSARFFLRKSQDSPVFYFQLSPLRVGDIGIVIKVFQQQEWLGSTRVHTSAYETEIGKVEISTASVSVLLEPKTRSPRPFAYHIPTHVEVELEELQKRCGVLTKRIQAIDTDISRATSVLDRQVLEERRSDYDRDRRVAARQMSFLESLTGRQLADFPEPTEADDERDD
jgi:hypothetical protein